MKRTNNKLHILAALCFVGLTGCGKSEPPVTDSPVPTQASGGSTTGKTITDGKIVKIIEAKLAADKTLNGATIRVQQQNTTIVLEGTVAAIAQKDRVEQIVIQAQKEANQPIGVQNNVMVKE